MIFGYQHYLLKKSLFSASTKKQIMFRSWRLPLHAFFARENLSGFATLLKEVASSTAYSQPRRRKTFL